MKISYYVASALDGYIAQEDGDVSWLDETGISMEDTGYDEFYPSVDAIIMGRKTHDMIKHFGIWPYHDKPTWVCSSQAIEPIEGCNLQTQVSPEEAIKEAKAKGIKNLWVVGGGLLASHLINKGLMSNIIVSTMPFILGSGIPLFDGLDKKVPLILKNTQVFTSGFTQLHYEIKGMKSEAML